jgi:hypothetical protein
MKHMLCWAVACACLLAGSGLHQPAWAGARDRVERQSTGSPRVFVPAAAAPVGASAAILDGLDYTALVPPGERLRVIEDEPYVYTLADAGPGRARNAEAVSAISLVSGRADGGAYEVRIIIRLSDDASQHPALIESFDRAADSAYHQSLITSEARGKAAYSLNEVRSPLGLTNPRDKYNHQREYLAYTAAVINPVGQDTAELATPYRFVNGQLKFIRKTKSGLALVTLEFTAREYPHSLTLTENLARAVVNRLDDSLRYRERLQYLSYQPEFEPALPYFEGEPIDQRTADLAEQPGEGCGCEALPITGDVCPACGADVPHGAAAPQTGTPVLELLGPQVYHAQCAQTLKAAVPFPPGAKFYNKFVQRYNLVRQRAALSTPGNCARCQSAAKAVCAACPVTPGQPAPETATPSTEAGGLPPELLSRLEMVRDLSARVLAAEGLSAAEEPVTLDGGATGVSSAH